MAKALDRVPISERSQRKTSRTHSGQSHSSGCEVGIHQQLLLLVGSGLNYGGEHKQLTEKCIHFNHRGS